MRGTRQDTSHLGHHSLHVVVDHHASNRSAWASSAAAAASRRSSDSGDSVPRLTQAPAQLLGRRRPDEHQHGVRELLPDLQRALDVDLEQDVVARGQVLLDRAPGRALEVAVDLEPLEEARRRRAAPRTRPGSRSGSRARRPPPGGPARVVYETDTQRSGIVLAEPSDDGALADPRGPGERRGARDCGGEVAVRRCGRSWGGRAAPSRWLRPRPRSRRLSLMSSSSMMRRACTLPTPGSDSSTLTTLSLASVSSRVPWSNSSPRLSDPALSFAFTSARVRRASAAFSSAAWRCSAVSAGGSGIRLPPGRRRRPVYAAGARLTTGSGRAAGSGRAPARPRRPSSDLGGRAFGIVGAGDRAADHEPVGAASDGVAGRVDARLVVRVVTGEPDAGHHRAQAERARDASTSVPAHTTPSQPRVARDVEPRRRTRRRSGRS